MNPPPRGSVRSRGLVLNKLHSASGMQATSCVQLNDMEGDTRSAKRPRLSMACNTCRRRKVKCDTDLPKCRNCRLRDDECITTDPRLPHVPVTREWITQPEITLTRAGPSLVDSTSIQSTVPYQPSLESSVPEETRQTSQNSNDLATRAQDEFISPTQQPYEAVFHKGDSTDRIKMVGSSSSQCLMKSLDVYLESVHMNPLSHHFRHGLSQVEEMEIPLTCSLPTLPTGETLDMYVTAYFANIHTLYPLFDIDKTKNSIERFALLSEICALPADQIPMLATTYLIVSLGADEDAGEITEVGTKYLVAAAGLLGHVILIPYLPAIQTLLLYTLAYRGRNKEGIGWQTLGMAIRIAHTIGLHRHSNKRPLIPHGVQRRYDQLFHARIWAICCSLEKMMQLESGRPATIEVVDLDHMLGPDQHPKGHNYLQWHMGLAQIQGLICHHIYGHKPGDRTAKQILSDIARLDRSLLAWVKEMPEEFKPGNDLFCSDHEFHIAAFFSMQYYQAMIAIHRAALIAPRSTFSSEVAKHTFDDSSRPRIIAGETICVSSARSIAKLAIDLPDLNVNSHIITAGPSLLACIVLGIYLMKNPGNRMRAADLELLKACVECTADRYSKSGYNALFVKGITSIYQQVQSYINRQYKEKVRSPQTSNSSTEYDVGRQVPLESQSQLTASNLTYQNQSSDSNINNASGMSALTTEFGISTAQTSLLNPSLEQQQEALLGMGEFSTLTSNQYSHSDAVPFDNLNVQELWMWMGDLSGYDDQSSMGFH